MAAGREKDWHNFQKKTKEKRVAGKEKKAKGKGAAALPDDTITVQRLSAEVTGKLQKYSRIGARVFVSYELKEYTIENIKSACMKHFGIPENGIFCCDVLPGEQGPSCFSVKQIHDFEVIHVRFIERSDGEGEPETKRPRPSSRPVARSSPVRAGPPRRATAGVGIVSTSHSCGIRPDKVSPESRFIPKSLFVIDMLKLGNQIKRTTTTIEIYNFDFQATAWSASPVLVDFNMEDTAFGVGGFREAFKATSKHKDYSYTTWVVKRYLDKSLEDMRTLGQTPEQHTKKSVQLHYLARNFAAQLHTDLEKEDNLILFGDTLSYNKVMLGYIRNRDEYVTVEEFVSGTFDKYINYDGTICGKNTNVTEKAECLAHYSYEKSKKEIMVVDIQGCGVRLFDPEVECSQVKSESEGKLFCAGNLNNHAIDKFVEQHKCNAFVSYWICQFCIRSVEQLRSIWTNPDILVKPISFVVLAVQISKLVFCTVGTILM